MSNRHKIITESPISSRIDKYKGIVEKKAKAGKPCDIIHIVKLDDSRESAFLIQDMFPITEEYIEREYTIGGNHLMLTSEHTANEIEQKARKVIGMLKSLSKNHKSWNPLNKRLPRLFLLLCY